MEERGLGTKATRADIIQKLYDRGYVFSNPPEPSETGIAMYEAFHEYVPRMATPEMTAELEHDMDEIAAGKTSRDEVVRISREMLHSTTADLQERREELAKQIWAGMDEDKFLGPCKVCEEAGRKHDDGSPNRLRIIELKGGKRMYGCEGWDRDNPESPDSCQVSGPLPGRGYELWRLDERCSICGEMPRLTVKGFRGRPWKLCLNDECPSMVEMREKREERKRARAAKDAADNGGVGRGRREARRLRRERQVAQAHPPRQALSGYDSYQASSVQHARQVDLGVFVTLEGIDRSGKTTQAALLAEALGPETLLLREPGGTDVGERIRDLLKDPTTELDPRAELLLFCAARAELCARVIRPSLDGGRHVVCDRFIDSTVAYQGAARGLGVEVVERLNEIVIADTTPPVTVLLRLDPDRAEARGQQRLAAGAEDGSDRFEAEGVELQRIVAAAYDELAARHPERIVAIDAEGSVGQVHARVMEAVSVELER